VLLPTTTNHPALDEPLPGLVFDTSPAGWARLQLQIEHKMLWLHHQGFVPPIAHGKAEP
jgi:hypothetical protein